MRILVTGGAGFVGSNFVHHVLEQHPDYEVLVVDKLTYAGNLTNLRSALVSNRLRFVRLDICDPAVGQVIRGSDLVVNCAAESYVDRSIGDARAFVRSNVEGTWHLLETCRRAGVRRFLQVSTDEVYGNCNTEERVSEDATPSPDNPNAATKAAADLMVLAFVKAYEFPAIVTRCSSNYGPYQFPEKMIPLIITHAGAGDEIPLYGGGNNIRNWIHVSDHCRALDLVLHRGRDGEIYNIGGDCEMRDIDVANRILASMNKPLGMIRYVKGRFDHQGRRYAVDCSKLKEELNWTPSMDFDNALAETIRWYQDNNQWLEQVGSGEYLEYFDRHYHRRELFLRQLNYR